MGIKILRFLKDNWSTVVATISLLGIVFGYVVPVTRDYFPFFVFLGINAVVWTLIEIKIALLRDIRPDRFEDMRHARPFILSKIRQALKKPRKSPVEISVVGGRIRTISDMIREIKNDIVIGKLRPKDVTIKIYCVCSDFLSTLNIAGLRNSPAFVARNTVNATLVRQLTEELLSYNTIPEFSANNIKLEIVHYRRVPYYYAFVIGNSHLFWGYFTWSRDSEDFEGPTNPCYYLSRRSSQFDDYQVVLRNWTDYLDMTETRLPLPSTS